MSHTWRPMSRPKACLARLCSSRFVARPLKMTVHRWKISIVSLISFTIGAHIPPMPSFISCTTPLQSGATITKHNNTITMLPTQPLWRVRRIIYSSQVGDYIWRSAHRDVAKPAPPLSKCALLDCPDAVPLFPSSFFVFISSLLFFSFSN